MYSLKILNLQQQFDDAIDSEDYMKAGKVLGKMKNFRSDAKAVIENQIVLDIENVEHLL